MIHLLFPPFQYSSLQVVAVPTHVNMGWSMYTHILMHPAVNWLAYLGCPDIWCDGIRWQWQQNLNICSTAALLELTARFDHVLSATPAVLLYQAFHPDQGLYILAEAVCPV